MCVCAYSPTGGAISVPAQPGAALRGFLCPPIRRIAIVGPEVGCCATLLGTGLFQGLLPESRSARRSLVEGRGGPSEVRAGSLPVCATCVAAARELSLHVCVCAYAPTGGAISIPAPPGAAPRGLLREDCHTRVCLHVFLNWVTFSRNSA